MFPKVTLESILSGFTNTMSDLKDLADNHEFDITKKTAKISDLQGEINDHDAEKTQALNILKNLETLLSKGN